MDQSVYVKPSVKSQLCLFYNNCMSTFFVEHFHEQSLGNDFVILLLDVISKSGN